MSLGLKLPIYATTSQPLIRRPYEVNYIFSFGETPKSLAKCDLLAKMADALPNIEFGEWIGTVPSPPSSREHNRNIQTVVMN